MGIITAFVVILVIGGVSTSAYLYFKTKAGSVTVTLGKPTTTGTSQ